MARKPAIEYAVPPVQDGPVFDTTTPSAKPVRRMTAIEVENYASWLIPLIQQYWDNPSQATVFGWLRMWCLDNQYNIACTDHSVGLAQLAHDPMNPRPHVEEVFLFCHPDHTEDGITIYEHWGRWAKTSNACEFRFNHVQGAPRDKIREIFPDLQYRKLWFVEFG